MKRFTFSFAVIFAVFAIGSFIAPSVLEVPTVSTAYAASGSVFDVDTGSKNSNGHRKTKTKWKCYWCGKIVNVNDTVIPGKTAKGHPPAGRTGCKKSTGHLWMWQGEGLTPVCSTKMVFECTKCGTYKIVNRDANSSAKTPSKNGCPKTKNHKHNWKSACVW